jgi:glycosyltransferase involved in cell wall biosynthesis
LQPNREEARAVPGAEVGAARPLRIAMVGHKGIPALHGGIERHVDEIARRLVRLGHRVDVFNRPYHPERSGHYEGVRVRRRPSLPTKHLDAGTHTALCVLESIVTRRYDIVHVHGIGPGIFVGWARPFVRTVFTFHAQDWRQQKWGRLARWSLQRGERVAVRRAHAVITVSRLLERYVHEKHGRAAHYIPNGATLRPRPAFDLLQRWGLVPGEYLLFVGRLISDRGLARLLEATRGAWSSSATCSTIACTSRRYGARPMRASFSPGIRPGRRSISSTRTRTCACIPRRWRGCRSRFWKR